ncbi:MAG: YggT family protein [Candidatus Cloacimonetes bacterium]|nr:YggT family protein [Candidatus Cloacimonadota bacterium]
MFRTGDVVAQTLVTILQLYNIIILIRVVMSWLVRDYSNPIFRFVYTITEPVLGRIRRLLPPMGLDLSPIILYFIINILIRLLLGGV